MKTFFFLAKNTQTISNTSTKSWLRPTKSLPAERCILSCYSCARLHSPGELNFWKYQASNHQLNDFQLSAMVTFIWIYWCFLAPLYLHLLYLSRNVEISSCSTIIELNPWSLPLSICLYLFGSILNVSYDSIGAKKLQSSEKMLTSDLSMAFGGSIRSSCLLCCTNAQVVDIIRTET